MDLIVVLALAVPASLVMLMAFGGVMLLFRGPERHPYPWEDRPRRLRLGVAVPLWVLTYIATCGFVASWLYPQPEAEQYGVSDTVTQSYFSLSRTGGTYGIDRGPYRYAFDRKTGTITYDDLSAPGGPRAINPGEQHYAGYLQIMEEMFDAAARASEGSADGPAIARVRSRFVGYSSRFGARSRDGEGGRQPMGSRRTIIETGHGQAVRVGEVGGYIRPEHTVPSSWRCR